MIKNYREIPLTKGFIALVDEDDYERINQYKWYASGDGYAWRKQWLYDGRKAKSIAMHRVIMGETDPKNKVDHINHLPYDNRKENLRICSHAQNICNQRKTTKCSSRYKGVSWNKATKKWRAVLNKGKLYLYKLFESENEAGLYYNTLATQHFGDFANLNIISEIDRRYPDEKIDD